MTIVSVQNTSEECLGDPQLGAADPKLVLADEGGKKSDYHTLC